MSIPYERIVAEDLDLGHGLAPITMPAGGVGYGHRVGIHSFLQEVYNPMDFGAVGDGATADTAALQAAIDASPAVGGMVLLPATGTFKSGNLVVEDKSNFTMRSLGARIQWVGTAPGTDYIGIQMRGTLVNPLFEGLILAGDGVEANRHAGIWNNSGAIITNVKFRQCVVTDVVFGLGAGATLSGSVQGFEASGNYIDNVVGEGVGTGYGIYHASVQGSPGQHVRIVNNEISRAGRHSIYQGGGNGVIIGHNSIRLHRTGKAQPASPRSAIVCSRSTDATIIGNQLDTCQDGGIEIDAGQDAASLPINAYNIAIIGNVMSNGLGVRTGIIIGTNRPDLNGFTSDVLISGNRVRTDGVSNPQLWIDSCLRCTVIGNSFVMLNVPGTASSIYVSGALDAAGTHVYTDDLTFQGNTVKGTNNGGAYAPIEIGVAAATSTIGFDFTCNELDGPAAAFSFDAAQTNPNIRVFETPVTGLSKSLLRPLPPFPLLLSVGVGVGGILRFIEPAGVHKNWQIAMQENLSDMLEITPSDVAGSQVFTYPVVAIRHDGVFNIGRRSDGTLSATLGLMDKTPATGITTVIVRTGAGQAGNTPIAVQDNAGAALSSLGANGQLGLKPVTYANLQGSPSAGTIQPVTDSTTNVKGNAIAGGGGNWVVAIFNGAAWVVL